MFSFVEGEIFQHVIHPCTIGGHTSTWFSSLGLRSTEWRLLKYDGEFIWMEIRSRRSIFLFESWEAQRFYQTHQLGPKTRQRCGTRCFCPWLFKPFFQFGRTRLRRTSGQCQENVRWNISITKSWCLPLKKTWQWKITIFDSRYISLNCCLIFHVVMLIFLEGIFFRSHS